MNQEEITPNTQLQHLETTSDFQACLASTLSNTRHSLCILSENLDDNIYHIDSLSTEITRINREAGKRSQIRILVKDAHRLINTPHPLAQLHRRLPSVVQIRLLTLQPQNEQINYLINDNQGLMFQHQAGIYKGFYAPEARAEAHRLLEEFNELWQRHSSDIQELRQLSL